METKRISIEDWSFDSASFWVSFNGGAFENFTLCDVLDKAVEFKFVNKPLDVTNTEALYTHPAFPCEMHNKAGKQSWFSLIAILSELDGEQRDQLAHGLVKDYLTTSEKEWYREDQ